MRIAYIPIDERPCNTEMVSRIASSSDIELVMPPADLLGYKKTAADNEGIWKWLLAHMQGMDALVVSMDMLVYGGLLPSRIHYLEEAKRLLWVERIKELQRFHPDLKIYASNLIMRTPRYSSSDEEPDYYETWGRDIFLRAFLTSKQGKEALTEEETLELQSIEGRLPAEFIQDYETRRNYNVQLNMEVLQLVKDRVIDFLVIPQDDSAEYGYTAQDQEKIYSLIDELSLESKVHVYPGADEVGATLLTRAYNDFQERKPKIYVLWSSVTGQTMIPKYEDRPFCESLKAHVLAAGAGLTKTETEADLILAYNLPGKVMQESWTQDKTDSTYHTHRNLLMFVEEIEGLIKRGRRVAVADSAFTNGGDRKLVKLLAERSLLDKLISYKGWNTNCNTLGSSIAQGLIARDSFSSQVYSNLIYHLYDDYIYQTKVRMEITKNILPVHDLNYFDLKDKSGQISEIAKKEMLTIFEEELASNFKHDMWKSVEVSFPWNRMFECRLDFSGKES